jgi:hypothetical protein
MMQNSGQTDLPFADGVPQIITANFELQSNAALPQAVKDNAQSGITAPYRIVYNIRTLWL